MPRKTFRKQITKKEMWEMVNEDNRDLVKEFLREKDSRSSDGTIYAYESDLKIFFTWNWEHNKDKFFVEIRRIEFSRFFSYATQELQWKSARFNRVRSALSSLSNFIEKYYSDEYPNYRNLVKNVESMPKVAAREKTILTEEQVNGLLDYLKNELNKPQEACLLALAIASGARISELMRFETDNIDEAHVVFDGIFLETLRPIKTKGRTKTGDMKQKYIIKDIFLPYYKDWLVEREKIMQENGKIHNFIFVKGDGSPAEVDTVRSWMVKWEEFLKVPFYPHCLRHYIVTYLTKIGLPAELIVAIMGWKSSEMYKIYNDLSAKDQEWKELDKLKDYLNKK